MAKILTEQQLSAIEWLARPQRGGKTLREIADDVGVSERTIQRWRTDEDFVKAVARRVMLASQDRLPEIMAAAPDFFLKDGNAALFRALMQTYGLMTDKVEIDQRTGDRPTDMASVRADIARLRADREDVEGDGHDRVQ